MQTALDAAEKLGPLIEYYEDPVAGLDGMAQLHRETGLPLATNMVVISFDGFRESIKRNSVQIVLSDHHYWGPARQPESGRHVPHLQPWAFDAFQLASGDQPDGHGASGRRHAQPLLCLRHALPMG
jgi:hypothetical protein